MFSSVIHLVFFRNVSLYFLVFLFPHRVKLSIFFCSRCRSLGILLRTRLLKLKLIVWSVYSSSLNLLLTIPLFLSLKHLIFLVLVVLSLCYAILLCNILYSRELILFILRGVLYSPKITSNT